MTAVLFHDDVRSTRLGYGVVVADRLEVAPSSAELDAALSELADRRALQPLDSTEEQRRRGCREMLRHGAFKPTGRAKPASEYLLRAATQGQLPRINGPVDANNLISLGAMVPVSLWDVHRSGSERFVLRRGVAGERYVFNPAGQELELEDLVCAATLDVPGARPVVTPVKDSLSTKVTPETRLVAGVIYYPREAGDPAHLERLVGSFGRWLGGCGLDVRVGWGVLQPGAELRIEAVRGHE